MRVGGELPFCAQFHRSQVGMEIHLDRVASSRALSFLGDRMSPKGEDVRIIPR